VEGYTATETDDELIAKALSSGGVNALFNRGVTFRDLWEANTDTLAERYPEKNGRQRPYDESDADMALAQHLAFWTGANCERMSRLMQQSALVRDKWDQDQYLARTVQKACSLQESFYSVKTTVATPDGAAKLRGSADQIAWAESIRANKLASATPEQFEALKEEAAAKTWIDAQDMTPQEMVTALTPVNSIGDVYGADPQHLEGEQYLPKDLQTQLFQGCAYVTKENKVYTPCSGLINQETFNSLFGGYEFEMGLRRKDTTKAWDAFLHNTLVKRPRVHGTCFRPREAPSARIKKDGKLYVNTYQPIITPSTPGDASLFLRHLEKLFPDDQDRAIITNYLAALVQHVGCKFQWAPFIQGVPGNGKSLLTFAIQAALGEEYCFTPLAHELDEKYNDWAFNVLFVGVEDVYVPESKQQIIEIIKPMITNNRLSKRGMHSGQTMLDLVCNWILNSNFKEGYRKDRNDRRIAPFFTPQQSETDLIRDGLDWQYFKALRGWLENGGYAVVTYFLQHFDIAPELNPALEEGGQAHRAPVTTSTEEAIATGLGAIEQEILEQVEQGVPGFNGGWISSVALNELLCSINRSNVVPRNRRRQLLQGIGYDYHPGLVDGKATRPIDIDGGKRPRLFVKNGHLSAGLTDGAAIIATYEKAQQADPAHAPTEVKELFSH
jgi:hypothetical protein